MKNEHGEGKKQPGGNRSAQKVGHVCLGIPHDIFDDKLSKVHLKPPQAVTAHQ
ncbi:hypothetical protein D3C86_1868830 [compost metagenome]